MMTNKDENLPYKIGKWYKVKSVCVASTDKPTWGLIANSSDGDENQKGWKPEGRLYKLEPNDLVMIAGYIFHNQILILGIADKFLYTEVSELRKSNALEEVK